MKLEKVLMALLVVALILGISAVIWVSLPPAEEIQEVPFSTPSPTPTPFSPILPSPTPSVTPTSILTPTPTPVPFEGEGGGYLVKVIKIKGPGDAIFNLVEDDYWWPGRTVEKWIELQNIGTQSLNFQIVYEGADKPTYDAKGDGANKGLDINLSPSEGHIEAEAFQRVLVRVYFPSESDNTCQGDKWEVTFKITSEEA